METQMRERFVRTPTGQTVRVLVCRHGFENIENCEECMSIKTPDNALLFLSETDEMIGKLDGQVKAAEFLIKQKKGMAFLDCDGTVAEKEARASLAPEVLEAQQEYVDAVQALKTLQAQRKTRELQIAVWQTTSANTRRGNIT